MEPSAYRLMAAIEDQHWWYQGRRDVLRSVLRTHACQGPGRIVEIGCGTGGNLEMLGEFGPVQGVESSPEARACMDPMRLRTVLEGALPDRIPLPQASFDWVCLFDVLEHIDDDVVALKTCRSLLTAHGTIIVTVPAYGWLWSAHDREHRHRRRYTRPALALAAQRAGLDTVFSSYFNTWLLPLAILARLKDRLLDASAPSGLGVPPAWLNLLLRRILASEGPMLKHVSLPFGLSVCAVLRAKE